MSALEDLFEVKQPNSKGACRWCTEPSRVFVQVRIQRKPVDGDTPKTRTQGVSLCDAHALELYKSLCAQLVPA